MAVPNIPDEVAADLGRAILTAIAKLSQGAKPPTPSPCDLCEGTGWLDVEPYIDRHGHIYSQVAPCRCGRVKAVAA